MLKEKILAHLPIPPSLSFPALYIVFPLILALILILTSRGWKKDHHRLPPGPPAIPIVGHLHLMGPLIHQSLQNLSHRYGPIFSMRLGSVPCIVVSSPDIAKEFLKVNEVFFLARKNLIAVKHLMNQSSYAFSSDGPYWKFVNKLIVTNFLNPRALNKFHTIRNENIQAFLRILANNSLQGHKTNLTHELTKLSSSIICYMMLGIRLHDAKGQANYEACRGLAREVTEIFGQFNVSDFIWLCKGLDLHGIKRRINEDVKVRYDSFIDNIITEREHIRRKKKKTGNEEGAAGDDHGVKSFLDVFLDLTEHESSIRPEEIKLTKDDFKAVVLDFLTAATDTSTVSIEWALAELLKNPSLLKKAQEEIDMVAGRKRLVQESDLRNLPYLSAIIKETYRLHPPIPLVVRRSTHDCNVLGYDIPRNTILFVNVWATGRDLNYWENPLDFQPERFFRLDDNTDNSLGLSELRGQNFQLMPFGTGKRSCPGVNLALQIVPTLLAILIQCFDWKLINVDGSVIDMNEKPGLTAPRASDLICLPLPRVDSSMILGVSS